MYFKEIIFHKKNLDLSQKTREITAVRGIIKRNDQFLFIYSAAMGDYMFPGGGVEKGESHKEALKREIKEECGIANIVIKDKIGYTIEYNSNDKESYKILKIKSYYYLVETEDDIGELDLEDYEEKFQLSPTWVKLKRALSANQQALQNDNKTLFWTKREMIVLKHIKENEKIVNLVGG